MWDLMLGILKKQFMEILALLTPGVPQVPAELKALTDNLKYQKAAKKRAKRELPTYKNATLDIFENRLSAYGYMKTQADTVQKNYKAIYNGNPEKEITVFVDNGYEQYLPPLKNRLADYMTLGINRLVGDQNKELSAGFDEIRVARDFPSVSAYTDYFNGLVDGSNLSVGLEYDHLYSMEQIAGEYYTAYHKQLVEKYGEEIVLRERMEPKNMTWAKKLVG